MDPQFPDWGDSPYVDLRLTGTLRLGRRTQPPLRAAAGPGRRQALLGRRGRGRQAAACRRGLAGRASRAGADHPPLPARTASLRAAARWPGWPRPTDLEPTTRRRARRAASPRSPSARSRWPSSAATRSSRRCASCGARRVRRPGLRRGALLRELPRTRSSPRSSASTCRRVRSVAAARLPSTGMPRAANATGITLRQSALTYADEALAGYDAAVLMEVDRARRPVPAARARATRVRRRQPEAVIVTTPNVEYNVRFETLPAGQFRHRDHRFEWTRAEFAAWADGVAERHGYTVAYRADRPGRPRGRPADADGRVRGGADEHARDSRHVARRADRRLRFGQVDLRAQALQARPRCSRATSAAGLVADDENDQSATTDAFDVLHYIAGQAAGRRTAHRRRRDQRAGRRAAPRSSRSPGSTTCCRSRSCSTCPSRSVSARNAGRPDRDFGATSSDASAATCAALAARTGSGRASGRSTSCVPSRRSTRQSSSSSRCSTTRAPRPVRSTSSATSTAAAPSSSPCSASSATPLDRDDAGRAGRRRHPDGRRVVFVGDLVDRGPDSPGRAASRDGHGRGRQRASASAATTRTSCAARCAAATSRVSHGLAETLAAAADRDRRSSERRQGNSSTTSSRTTCSTTASWWSRTPGCRSRTTAARPGGCAASRCTATPPGETDEFGLPVRYPWANDYRGRAMVLYGHTPDDRRGVGQQHHVPGHRLRLRRPADRPALSGARTRVGSCTAGLVRAGQAAGATRPGRRGRRAPRAGRARPRRRRRQARRRDPRARPGDGATPSGPRRRSR